ncbi:mucin-associated surface protein (MASP), putative [Trypanosoma cruzi marinkellei]|uniref:Mucin-associated surface protein (MASP), putative n=1 Tax=Trypanosoma cruzi marinkellei TaxID=85056 RepID=K2NEV8_TRYCR|nr:mucin-associated surface protein (MASP), putative [Trypanosoma cruzi marinkellei]
MGEPKKEVQLPEETGTKNISSLSGHAAGAPNTGAQHQNPVTGGAQSVGNAAMLSSNSQASLREKTRENGESMGHETKDVSEGQHKQPADSGKALAGLSNAKTPEAETQRPKTTSANEKNDSRNTNVSTTLPDAKEGHYEEPTHTAGEAQGKSTDSQGQAATPSSDGRTSPPQEENSTGTTNTKNNQPPKETPVEATVMKNTTATTGDSDGSTAVSRTTSPLLLLVFACAAVVVTA